MRILLIHQAFASFADPGGTRHYEFARHLAAQGHNITIITSRYNYLTGKPTDSADDGTPTVKNLRIRRVYGLPTLHRGFAWRVLSFVTFMLLSCVAGWQTGPVDVVIGTSPPLFQALSAWLVAVLRRRPFVLEIRDLWPEFAIDMGILKNPLLIALSRGLERFLYARADHLIVNSPAYRDYLQEKGVSPNRITFIPNSVDPTMFSAEADGARFRQRLDLGDRFVVTYAGAMGQANDLPTLLRAAQRLRHQPDIHFLLVGDGMERSRLEKMATAWNLHNVTFAGPFAKAAMPALLAAADACVATMMNIPRFRMTYPNKVFDYMAAGKPTALAIDGVIRAVMEEAGGGICVEPGDDAALAEAVQRLAHDRQAARAMGAAARRHVIAHFDRRQQAIRLEALLLQIARRPQ